MSEEAILATSADYPRETGGVQRRDRFFLGMSATLLSILLIGFAPTLYLRVFFEAPPIPLYLHVHGIVVTSWFVWLVLQASLVHVRRTDLHRRIGLAGVGIAVAVVIAGPMATLNVAPRLVTNGVELEPLVLIISWVVSLNSTMVLGFVIFLCVALSLRRRPNMHKRFMLFASLSLIPPAVARISFWPIFSWAEEPPLVTGGCLLLLAPMIVHDLIVEKHLHTATVLGSLGFALIMLVPLAVRNAEFIQAFVRGSA
ncbi:MAG: hypothetical protein HKN84_09575 [Gammaproteobacteria bacterium]|nr:hypothetical protein [Gammaproteobacteria bacterium]